MFVYLCMNEHACVCVCVCAGVINQTEIKTCSTFQEMRLKNIITEILTINFFRCMNTDVFRDLIYL